MLLTFKDGDNKLTVDVNLDMSVSMLLMKPVEVESRLINRETGLEKLPISIAIEVNEKPIYCIGKIRDIVYNNSLLIMYNKEGKTLFVMPDVTDVLKLFKAMHIDVTGTVLGSTAEPKVGNVDTYSINYKHSNKNMSMDLDVALLDTIKIESLALNISGTYKPTANFAPKYLKSDNGDIISYDSSYIVSALAIEYGDSIISSNFRASLVYGNDTRNNRALPVTVEPDFIKDEFTTLFAIE